MVYPVGRSLEEKGRGVSSGEYAVAAEEVEVKDGVLYPPLDRDEKDGQDGRRSKRAIVREWAQPTAGRSSKAQTTRPA